MDAKKIGAQIQLARKAAGMTQDALAQAVGLSTKYVSNLECGNKTAKLETFILICNALHVDANTLLADELDCSPNIAVAASMLSKRLEKLPPSEQKKILHVVEVMVEDHIET